MKYLILLFITNLSFANYSGFYTGEGFFYSHRNEGKCSDVFFELKDTKSYFEIVQGGYNCSSINAQFPNSKFIKKGSKLLYEGENVGYYDSKGITIFLYEGMYNLALVKLEKRLIFKETWISDGDFLTIKSDLEKNDP